MFKFRRAPKKEKDLPAIDPRSTVDLLREMWDVRVHPKKKDTPPSSVNSDIYSVPPKHPNSGV